VAEMVKEAEAADVTIAMPPTEIRSGVTIAMLEDPDGNWVELVDHGQ
jgi:predicted enzyme related to lactoylglutathione lyase